MVVVQRCVSDGGSTEVCEQLCVCEYDEMCASIATRLV